MPKVTAYKGDGGRQEMRPLKDSQRGKRQTPQIGLEGDMCAVMGTDRNLLPSVFPTPSFKASLLLPLLPHDPHSFCTLQNLMPCQQWKDREHALLPGRVRTISHSDHQRGMEERCAPEPKLELCYYF